MLSVYERVFRWTAGGALLVWLGTTAAAGPECTRPRDAMAVQTAAVQQEMMVAAIICNDIAAYNRFVLSHRAELQEADRALMRFFRHHNAASGFADYNRFKTELANAAAVRSIDDSQFCRRVDANFAVALGRSEPLGQLLRLLPYPAATGSVSCPQYALATTPVTAGVPQARVRHRNWPGKVVHTAANVFD